MSTMAPKPIMCGLPAAPQLKPKSVVTEVSVPKEEPQQRNKDIGRMPAAPIHQPPKSGAPAVCDSELHARARDFVDYFKLQAAALQHVLDDHARELELRQAAEADRDHRKHEAEQSAKKNRELEAALAAATAAAATLEVRAHNAEKKLKDTEEVLEKTKKDLTKAESERDAAQKGAATLRTEHDTAQKERDAARKERDTFKTERDALQTDLNKAKEDITWYENRVKELKGLLQSANDGQDKANQEVEKARAEVTEIEKVKDQAIKDKQAAEDQVHELQKSQGPPLKTWIHNPAHLQGKYYIDSIEYGGKFVTDPKVYKSLLAFAVKGKEFQITNHNMGGDPWPHWTKTCNIAYTVDNKGPFRYITGWEKEWYKFEQ